MLLQEGAAFLEKHGKVDEDVKTRAQQKQVEEAVDETVPKLARTTTMAETAKVNGEYEQNCFLLYLKFVKSYRNISESYIFVFSKCLERDSCCF